MTGKAVPTTACAAQPGTNVIPFPGTHQAGSALDTHPEVKIPTAEKTVAEKSATPATEQAEPVQPLRTDDLLANIESLSSMGLREKYPREASSHKNMLYRAPGYGGVIAPEFKDFRSFLSHVGVMPGPGKWTLDRISNDCRDYGPGLVRWATPTTQNNNKGDTVLLAVNGKVHPLTTWAAMTGQDPNTLRKRRSQGWKDHEVVHGRRRAQKSGRRTSTDSWVGLLAGHLAEHEGDFESEYLQSRMTMPEDRRPEPRSLWLAAVAWHSSHNIGREIREILESANYRGVDPEPHDNLLARQQAWWETHHRAANALHLRHGIRYQMVEHAWKKDRLRRPEPED